METFLIVVAASTIVFIYTIDWPWVASKAFDLIGGCNEN